MISGTSRGMDLEPEAALAALHQPADLVDLLAHRTCEPLRRTEVPQPAERGRHADLLDVVQVDTAVRFLDLEPRMHVLRDAVLQDDVDRMRPLPLVARDHRARETAEELAVLARDHPVLDVAELDDVDDLRVGLGVLRRVEHEVEHLVRRDTRGEDAALAADHALPACEVRSASIDDGWASFG